jgi:integrase
MFKRSATAYRLPDGSSRLPDGTKITKDTPGAVRVKHTSKVWYARLNGNLVRLTKDKEASKSMLARLRADADLGRVGIKQHKRPLSEYLADWETALRTGAKVKHVKQTVACARSVIEGCGFAYLTDVSLAAVQRFLGKLRERRRELPALTEAQYTKKQLAALLGIKPAALTSLIRRHRLEATGNGKARRFPRATAEALLSLRARGRSIKTVNLYASAVKAFLAWIVDGGINPLEKLAGGNVKLDRRHDRRPLSLEELRAVIGTARSSPKTFRGLSGLDRAVLYSTAVATGFRASELASLCPESFDLNADEPTANLAAQHAKNGKPARQPLPPGVAEVLADYLADRPAGKPVWPGTWPEKAAEMFAADLDDAGIPYTVEGPDGPLFADFHSLRHSMIALLDRTGATLKEAMQLARHSDPKLTMAVYGRAEFRLLGEAVRRLPSLTVVERSPEVIQATGTDGAARSDTGFALANDGDCYSVRGHAITYLPEGSRPENEQPLVLQGVESDCEPLRLDDESSPRQTLFVTIGFLSLDGSY